MVGDVVHNLRSALDHLARSLVIANGGTPHKSTAYPISHTREAFEASLSNVKAAGQEALDLIRETKAYRGGNDGLWALRELDDRDKHRLLLTIAAAHNSVGIDLRSVVAKMRGTHVAEIPPLGVLPVLPKDRQFPLKNGDVVLVSQAEDHPDFQIAIDIAFGEPDVLEGEPILPTLWQLLDLVSDLTLPFAPMLLASLKQAVAGEALD
jgi:hypothetical protein